MGNFWSKSKVTSSSAAGSSQETGKHKDSGHKVDRSTENKEKAPQDVTQSRVNIKKNNLNQETGKVEQNKKVDTTGKDVETSDTVVQKQAGTEVDKKVISDTPGMIIAFRTNSIS